MAPPRTRQPSPRTQKSTFNKGARGTDKPKRKIPMRRMILLAVPLILIGGGIWVQSLFIAPKGSNLYGVCRGYIEQQMQFPETLKIVEFKEKIPEGENPASPQRLDQEVTFSGIDGFGSRTLHTVTCGFKFDQSLVNTPWQGILLEKVLFDNQPDHGWADVYYPPNDPRAAQDKNNINGRLEYFFNGIPSLLAHPPDLTLPMHDINRMAIEDLQDL